MVNFINQKIMQNIFHFLDGLNLPNLNDNDGYMLGQLITEKESFDTICTFAKDKTPVSEVLPIELYRTISGDVKTILCAVFNECYAINNLCTSMRRGIITLIPPKDKDLLLLKYWRPIFAVE